MTNRVLPRHVAGLAAGIVLMCGTAMVLIAPRARAQDPEFRSNVSIAGGPIFPVGARPPFDELGSTYMAAISVGDDFSTVGFALGYSVFGASPLADRGTSVSQFELRADCVPFSPDTWSPYLRLGAGAYNVDLDRSIKDSTSRRVGIATGVGVRWAPRWHTAMTLVASYHNVPSRGTSTRQWIGLTLELLRWMD